MGPPLVPGRVNRSYPAKLVAGFAIVTLLIGAAGIGLYSQADRMLEQETQTELESAAQIEARALDEWFEQKRIQTLTAGEAAAFESHDETVIVQHLWSIVERDGDTEAAYFVDTANGTVVSSVGSSRIVSAADVVSPAGQRDFTTRARGSDRVTVSEPFRPYEGGAPVILLSAAVPEHPHRRLVTVVNLRQLSDSQAHQLAQARFEVVDSQGAVVMAENASRILGPTGLSRRPAGDTGFDQLRYDGEQAAVGYARMDARDWVVAAWLPTTQAFALRSAIVESLGWMLLTVIAGLGAIGLLLTRSTIQPVRELATEARRLQAGSLDDPISTDRTDEFGELYEAFEEMRRSLREQIARAERARQDSEQLTETLEQEAEAFGEVMAACADGELDRRLDPESDNPSMQQIATAFNEMMDDVEQQNEELEAFTSIISHDLRNPLTVAYGRAKLLEDPATAEHVDPLIEALDRMQRIVDDGLTLARGTQLEATDTVELAERARTAWSHVETFEASLRVAEATVQADPDLLDQLFENLFRNAIEHGGQDVAVTVGTSEGGFYVADDGPGFSVEKPDSVFKPGISDGSGGTGLGLTIVKRIAAAHEWHVRARDDDGARFEFVVRPTVAQTNYSSIEATTDGADAL